MSTQPESPVHKALKLVSYITVLLMLVAAVYSGYISVAYWSGISV